MTTALFLHIALTAAVTTIWFQSDLPMYLSKWLRAWKILPQDPNWYPDKLTMDTWLRHEWEEWVTLKNPELAHLLLCPVCFTSRASLAAAVWTTIFTGQWLVVPFCLIAVPFACMWLKLLALLQQRGIASVGH